MQQSVMPDNKLLSKIKRKFLKLMKTNEKVQNKISHLLEKDLKKRKPSS